MKRNKHITVNINEEDYQMLVKLACYYRRSISELTALILVDNIKQLFLDNQKNIYESNKDGFKQAVFIPSNKIN